MRKIRMILIMAMTVLLSSCSDDIANLSEGMERQGPAGTSLDRGLTRAEALLGRIEGRTRGTKRLVESVSYVSTHKGTRSADCDSLYYLVNYADNQGFAVLGATEDNEGVYAISGEGHLEMEDTLDNPGLAIFFDMLSAGGAVRPGIGNDSVSQMLPYEPMVTKDLSSELKPLLAENVRSWNQDYPFNAECVFNGVRCKVGCAPLAFAMFMSYYEWPLSYESTSFDWKAIKNAYFKTENGRESSSVLSAKICTLVRAIGSAENLRTEYGVRESSTYTKSYYKTTFKNFGYKNIGKFEGFSTYELKKFLSREERPVLMRGSKADSNSGHVWVVDGYYYDWHWSNVMVGDGYYGEGCLFHIVWGWDGFCNGYFKIGDGMLPKVEFNGSEDEDRFTDAMKKLVQYYELEYLGDVEPDK